MGNFSTPKWIPQPKPEQIVWHYTDFDVYENMVKYESLRFSNVKYFKKNNDGSGEATFSPRFIEKALVENTRINEGRVFFSSWHLNSEEQGDMWATFAIGSHGIALRTTVQRLHDVFKNSVNKAPIATDGMCGRTTYPDEDIADVSDLVEEVNGNLDIFFLIRNPYFQYESEFRLLLFLNPMFRKNNFYDLPIDGMNSLVQAVHYKPSSVELQRKLEALHSQHIIEAKIVSSSVAP